MSEPRRGRPRRLLAGAIAALLATGCGEPPPVRETLLVFGSEARLELRGIAPARAQPLLATAAATLQAMHRDWHPWEPGALTDFNAALASGAAVPIPAMLEAPLARSRELATASDGLFDPAIGWLVGRWGFHTGDYPIRTPAPDEATLQTWRANVPGLADLQPDGAGVRSRHPLLQLDFSAIAEGFAAVALARELRAAGVTDALIALGGDVHALGRAGKRPWQVAIRDPFAAAGAALAAVELHDGESLFSSGSYARFRAAPAGERWPHVLDPRSGLPVRGVATVAVLHDDPVLADAAATALMVGGPDRLAELAARMGVRCALLLTEDDTLLLTAAMQARIRLQREPARQAPLLPPAGACATAPRG